MSEFSKFMREQLNEEREHIHTAILARIERYNAEKMQADIKPLVKEKHGEMPLIKNAAVSCLKTGDFIIRPPYAKGDLVVAVIVERSIDNVIFSGDESEQVGERKHDLQDAVVIGGITCLTEPLTGGHSEDLLISKKDEKAKVVIKPDNEIIIESEEKVYLGSSEAEEGVPLGSQLKEWLDGHTHDYSWTDSGGSGTTDAPGSESPEPSEKVVVE